MTTVVVSDLHLGSAYFLYSRFKQFLDWIPEGWTLVLNGDTIDQPLKRLPKTHLEVLDRLIERSKAFPVVWITGNHDKGFQLDDPGGIVIKTCHTMDERIYMAHGNVFDQVMPSHRWFIYLFHLLHTYRIKLGARSVHVACYAKRYKLLYSFLRKNVMRKAVAFAQRSGFNNIACGHTHYAEDQEIDGIRYINTGAWTESPAYCLVTDGAKMHLINSDAFCRNIDLFRH